MEVVPNSKKTVQVEKLATDQDFEQPDQQPVKDLIINHQQLKNPTQLSMKQNWSEKLFIGKVFKNVSRSYIVGMSCQAIFSHDCNPIFRS